MKPSIAALAAHEARIVFEIQADSSARPGKVINRATQQGPPLDIAVIILNFNGRRDTCRALQSLRFSSAFSVLPIVIDNGSDENEAAILQREFPEAYVERLEENLGFARGINYAARIALGLGVSYMLLLNNDAWLENPEFVLRRLVFVLSSNPSLAAVGPMIVDDDTVANVQSAGYRYSLWWPFPRAVRRVIPNANGLTFLSGCCLLVSAESFIQLEGLDPDFFLYGEDLDFALRARGAGRALALVPDVRVRHRRGASSRLLSERYVYTALRGNLIVILKHAHWYQLPTAALTSIAISLGLTILGYRVGSGRVHRAVIQAWVDFASRRWGGLDGYRLKPAPRPRLADWVRQQA